MWSKHFSFGLICLHQFSLLPMGGYCRKTNCVFSGKWNQCTNFWLKKEENDKAKRKNQDSSVFEILLHMFSQALRATFVWGMAAQSLYSACSLNVSLHGHPNITESCSHSSHPSRWAAGVGLSSLSDVPAGYLDVFLYGRWWDLLRFFLSQTEKQHCTCVSATILPWASPLRWQHKQTNETKGV